MTTTKIFLTGATGYIGGTVLGLLLEHRLANTFEITILVRDSQKAKGFEALGLGLKTVVGSYSDLELLTSEASKADYVFACVDADNLDAAKAILAGSKKYYERTGKQGILIHTSGTGVLSVETEGLAASETVYSDLDIPLIETLDAKQPHRWVDVAIVQADKEGYVKTYLVLPSTIYGRVKNIFVKNGLQKAYSQQVPKVIEVGLAKGQGVAIGEGKNLWSSVDIYEVAELFVIIFDLTLAEASGSNDIPKQFEHGRGGYYFGANGEHALIDVYKAVAKALSALGIGSPEPVRLTDDEVDKYFGRPNALSTNSRSVAERSKAIGWKPVKTRKDLLASIEEEVKIFASGRK